MQLCDLDDLYNKFKVIKTLRIGSTIKPRFNYSDGYSIPSSDGDILYEKSKFDLNEQTGTEDTTTIVKPIADMDDTRRNNTSHSTNKTHSTTGDKAIPDSQVASSDVSGEDPAQPSSLTETKSDPPMDINDEEFEGPLTKCLEEEDSLILDDTYVPNNVTVRVKVFLPNKHPVTRSKRRFANQMRYQLCSKRNTRKRKKSCSKRRRWKWLKTNLSLFRHHWMAIHPSVRILTGFLNSLTRIRHRKARTKTKASSVLSVLI